MKKRLIAPMLLSAASLAFFAISGSAQAAAYTDYSLYKVEPSNTFSTESQASQAVAKLEKDTGWDHPTRLQAQQRPTKFPPQAFIANQKRKQY